jgi:Holliday junction resolvase-like predicted endonuclease
MGKTDKATLAKSIGIATRYLEDSNPGFKVVKNDFKGLPLVAREGDEIVFVRIVASKGIKNGFPEPTVTRQEFEMAALSYLAATNEPSARVRFDVVSLVHIGDGKVFLRYHRDAMATD